MGNLIKENPNKYCICIYLHLYLNIMYFNFLLKNPLNDKI